MIPPEDKAMELMLKYYNSIPMNTVSFAKKCALIAIDEVINNCTDIDIWEYLQEVKLEIENL